MVCIFMSMLEDLVGLVIDVCCCRQYLEGRLKLLELSLDTELAYNAVELVLESPDLLPDVSIHEVEVCDVVVLFGTSTTVYRLTLPHPARIKQVHTVIQDGVHQIEREMTCVNSVCRLHHYVEALVKEECLLC